MGQSSHGRAQERLGGVGDIVPAEGGDRLPATSAQMLLVVHEEGCSEALCQVGEQDPSDSQPFWTDLGRAGQQTRFDG